MPSAAAAVMAIIIFVNSFWQESYQFTEVNGPTCTSRDGGVVAAEMGSWLKMMRAGGWFFTQKHFLSADETKTHFLFTRFHKHKSRPETLLLKDSFITQGLPPLNTDIHTHTTGS